MGFGIEKLNLTLAADLHQRKGVSGKLTTITVCNPFGAVKEQMSGLYAQTIAEQVLLVKILLFPKRVKCASITPTVIK